MLVLKSDVKKPSFEKEGFEHELFKLHHQAFIRISLYSDVKKTREGQLKENTHHG
jgi:hypothetical protein